MFACGCAHVSKPRVYLIADHSSTALMGCHGRCRLLCNKDAVLNDKRLFVSVCIKQKVQYNSPLFKHIALIHSLIQ